LTRRGCDEVVTKKGLDKERFRTRKGLL
jgi:hypothetical protein